ncbi:MAG: ABC transporter related [Anaerolineae bacterium]|nr:MAG: ABC transporter related [Anaerolineae bacterium]
MNLVEIRQLSLWRGQQEVLRVPSLDIRKGEILAIIGPNGAGKSTLLLALAGLIQPHRGDIYFAGRSLMEWKGLDYRRQIALVLQEPLLFDRTVIDNVILGLRFRGLKKETAIQSAREWLERLGITHLDRRRALSLSGGEAQRVSLARAFVLRPQLLLLDEPFSSLDPPTRLALLQDLRSLLKQHQFTAAFVTHHLGEAAFLGDRIAVLGEGEVKQVGSLEQIQEQPQDSNVADFIRHLTTTEAIYYK